MKDIMRSHSPIIEDVDDSSNSSRVNETTGFSPLRKKNRSFGGSTGKKGTMHSDPVVMDAQDDSGFSHLDNSMVPTGRGGGMLFSSQPSQPFTQDTMLDTSIDHSQPFHPSVWGKFAGGGGALFQSQESNIFPLSQASHCLPSSMLSQPMFQASQLSQDFAERMGQLHVQEESFQLGRVCQTQQSVDSDTQDSFDVAAALMGGENSLSGPAPPNSAPTRSHPHSLTHTLAHKEKDEVVFSAPAAPSSKHLVQSRLPQRGALQLLPSSNNHKLKSQLGGIASSSSGSSNNNNSDEQTVNVPSERQVELHPVMENPFLKYQSSSNGLATHSAVVFNHPTEDYFQTLMSMSKYNSLRSALPRLSKIWISPYQERSRYFTEFEELLQLGTGTFSKVCYYSVFLC
jgi:hypothetical protein